MSTRAVRVRQEARVLFLASRPEIVSYRTKPNGRVVYAALRAAGLLARNTRRADVRTEALVAEARLVRRFVAAGQAPPPRWWRACRLDWHRVAIEHDGGVFLCHTCGRSSESGQPGKRSEP